MPLTLTPETEAKVRGRVERGPYRTADEVIAEALDALAERERSERQLQQLRAKLQVGLDQLDRGERIPFTPELRAERARLAARRAEAGERPKADVCP